MSDTLKICAIAIICSIVCVIVKGYSSGFLVPVRIAGIILIYSLAVVILSPLIEYLVKIMGNTVSIENVKLMIKAISIAYVTQITSNVCRDCGENNLAAGIDTIGKIEIIILALPLIDGIINISEELASW